MGFAFVLLGGTTLFGFQWPVEELILTATFAESRWDHFHTGIDIGGGEQEIRPVEEGEIVYYYEEGNRRSGIPAGLGNFVVVEHKRDLRSVYAHLEAESFDPSLIEVNRDTVIGVIGDSGGSYGKHLHLEVIDRELGRFVNPLLLLPPLEDNELPVIRGVHLMGEGYSLTFPTDENISQGRYSLVLDVYDPSEHVSYFCPMSPFDISVYLNGQEVVRVQYQGIEEQEGRMELIDSSGVTHENFYLDEWLVHVGDLELNAGETSLEITVKDIAGNETGENLRFSVSN